MWQELDLGVSLDPGLGVAVSDAETRVLTMVSPEFARMHGFRVDEMRGMPLWDLLAPSERPRLPKLVRESEALGEHRFRTTHARKDGSTFPVQVNVAVVRDPSGRPTRRIGFVIDLERTGRTRAIAEGSARAMEDLATDAPLASVLERIVEMIEGAVPEVRCSILVADRNGACLRSTAGKSLPRFYTEAVDGLKIEEGSSCCGTAAFRGERVVVEDVLESTLGLAFLDVTKEADIRACWSEPIKTPDGVVVGTFAMYYQEPATPGKDQIALLQVAAHLGGVAIGRRRTEEELRDEKERYRTLVEFASEAIAVLEISPTGLQIIEANPKASALIGRESGDLLGCDFYSLAPARQPGGQSSREQMEALLRASRRGLVPEAEWLLRDGDGGEVPCEIRLASLPSSGLERVRVCITDIRGRKREELARRALDERGQNLHRLESLGLLAGGVAHDFNNLLVGILGHASLALMELPADSPAKESIEAVEAAARRAADLAAEMLAYSGRAKQNREPVDLSAVIEETLPLIESLIPRSVEVELSHSARAPVVEADPTQLRQIVMNLVSNAAQAIGGVPGKIFVRTDFAYLDGDSLLQQSAGEAHSGTFVTLEVTDDGCGMDEATRARIFDPFFTTRLAGRGLGLASVQGIVRGHGGEIVVESRPGEGTTFKVLIPAGNAAVDGSKGDPIDADRSSLERGSGRVLIVDDEPEVRDFCAIALRRAGYDPAVCESGDEAIEMVERSGSRPAAVLVDLMMPGTSGDETIRRLRRIYPGLPAVLSSGYRRDEPSIATLGRGVLFLPKPYTIGELLKAMEEILDGGAEDRAIDA